MFHLFNAEGIRHDETLESLARRSRELAVLRKARTRKSPPVRDDEKSAAPGDPRLAAALKAYTGKERIPVEGEAILHVSEIMSRPVVVINAAAKCDEAIRLCQEHEYQSLPVVGDDGNLVGLISEKYALARLLESYRSGGDGEKLLVSDVMRTPILTTSLTTDIRRVALAMFEHRIGAMPVVNEEGKLSGIITRGDILHALVKSRGFAVTA